MAAGFFCCRGFLIPALDGEARQKGHHVMSIESKGSPQRIKFLAGAGLILTTIIWGSAFVVMKHSVDKVSPCYLLAVRFSVAFLCMLGAFWPQNKGITKRDLRCGTVLGSLLFASYFFQTYGLKYTTASKNAFITTLYVILVPFFHWAFSRRRPKGRNLAAAVIAVAGLALLSLEGDFSVNVGDLLTLICGVFFAVHIVFIDRYTEELSPVRLTTVQMAVSAAFGWLLAPVLEGEMDFSIINPSLILGFLYLGIFSTMIGFLLQTAGQKYLTPNTSAILLSFESVFGLVFSVIFLGDPITGKLLVGCCLMFAAVIISEYSPASKGKKSE